LILDSLKMVFALTDQKFLAAAAHKTWVIATWRAARALGRWWQAARAASLDAALADLLWKIDKEKRVGEVARLPPPGSPSGQSA
jgi:hypothetical protein